MAFLTIILGVITVIAAFLYYFKQNTSYFKDLGIPYKKPYPFLGSMWEMFAQKRSISEMCIALYEIDKKAKYVGAFDFVNPLILIRDPELIKQITVKNFDSFTDHKVFANAKEDFLFSKMLFTLKGDKWREMRALLSPSFTSSKMKIMFELMYKCAENYAETLKKMAENSAGDGKIVDVKDVLNRFTNDVIATCAFGIGLDSIKEPNNPFYKLGKTVSNFDGIGKMLKFFFISNLPKISSMLRLRFISQEATDFFMNVIDTSIKTRDEKGIVRPDMIQLMMDTGRNRKDAEDLTLEDMTSQAFIFFFAGFDTTATAMSFAVQLLGINPEIQEKLLREIEEIWQNSKGEPRYEHINSAEYLTAVVEETLRLYPIQVMTDRVCVKEYELPPCLPGSKPLKLQKDSNVWFPVYALHRDPAYFGKDADDFVPERFLKENRQNIDPTCYMPFGAGPRMCIGNRFALLEIKVLLFHLLSRIHLVPCEKTKNPIEINKRGMTLQPQGGFWLKFQARKPSLADKFKKEQS